MAACAGQRVGPGVLVYGPTRRSGHFREPTPFSAALGHIGHSPRRHRVVVLVRVQGRTGRGASGRSEASLRGNRELVEIEVTPGTLD